MAAVLPFYVINFYNRIKQIHKEKLSFKYSGVKVVTRYGIPINYAIYTQAIISRLLLRLGKVERASFLFQTLYPNMYRRARENYEWRSKINAINLHNVKLIRLLAN